MKNIKALIVVGLGYGDEGKGLVTDYLCLHSKKPLVIRFNGGPQAGHTVVKKTGESHVFSNFGAGTLRNIPTYWSSFCTFSPAYFLEEYKMLPVTPKIIIDPLCPVTTHYDVLYNRAIETTRGNDRHGSCGLGFGATVNRHHIAGIKLFVKDLLNSSSLKNKLQQIRLYYQDKINTQTKFSFADFDHESEDKELHDYVSEIKDLHIKNIVTFGNEEEVFSDREKWQTLIFEGAQGILLDVNFGIRPYVTKSNTTSKNALEIIRRNFKNSQLDIEIFYVSRAYLTRHGAGPFRKPDFAFNLINNDGETNKHNKYQGAFQISCLDINLLNYSIKCDEKLTKHMKKNLIITCLDQLEYNNIPVYKNENLSNINYKEIEKLLNCKFKKIKYSFSNRAENLK